MNSANFLKKRGMVMEEKHGKQKFRALQAEMAGRVAVSTAITAGIVKPGLGRFLPR
jgi:hypothetical protein